MSSREMFEAAGRLLPLTVLAGEARVLLLVLPSSEKKKKSTPESFINQDKLL